MCRAEFCTAWNQDFELCACSCRYASASLKNEVMISSMMIPTGKAAMMDTVCRLDMEFSEKISASGSRIRKTAQNSLTFRCGSSSLFYSL